MAVLLVGRASAFAAEHEPRAAIVTVDVPPSLARDRAALETAIARGLEAAGWAVVAAPEVGRKLGERRAALQRCTGDTCLVEITRLVDTPYLVRGTVSADRRKYSLDLALFYAPAGAEPVAQEQVECLAKDPCPPVAQNATRAARVLGRKGIQWMRERAAAEPVAASRPAAQVLAAPLAEGNPPASGPAPSSIESPSSTGIVSARADAPAAATWKPTAAWIGMGGGAALMATSIYYFVSDGNEADCENTAAGRRCFKQYDDATKAWVLGGAGFLSAAAGAAYLLFFDERATTRVGVGPSGMFVSGRF